MGGTSTRATRFAIAHLDATDRRPEVLGAVGIVRLPALAQLFECGGLRKAGALSWEAPVVDALGHATKGRFPARLEGPRPVTRVSRQDAADGVEERADHQRHVLQRRSRREGFRRARCDGRNVPFFISNFESR